MTTATKTVTLWMLDSSLFIHFVIIERFHILVRRRAPLRVPEYVYRVELTGARCQDATRARAEAALRTGEIELASLSLEDLGRIASIGPSRKAAIGEITCALLAERHSGGVLIDDQKARRRLEPLVNVRAWDSTEDVLIEAAHRFEITETELDVIQETLTSARYRCRFHLRTEYLVQRLARGNPNGGG